MQPSFACSALDAHRLRRFRVVLAVRARLAVARQLLLCCTSCSIGASRTPFALRLASLVLVVSLSAVATRSASSASVKLAFGAILTLRLGRAILELTRAAAMTVRHTCHICIRPLVARVACCLARERLHPKWPTPLLACEVVLTCACRWHPAPLHFRSDDVRRLRAVKGFH